MSQDAFTKELDRLVTKFTRDQAFYASKDFQESELRVEFTSPLFEALGWDVSNRAGNPPHLREVILETGAKAKSDYDKTNLQRQISSTDRQINYLVYGLYGLTKDEIKLVEENSS